MRISEWRNITFWVSLILGLALFAAGSVMGQQKSQAPNATQATPSTTLSDAQKQEVPTTVKESIADSRTLRDTIETEIETKVKKNVTDYEKSINTALDSAKTTFKDMGTSR